MLILSSIDKYILDNAIKKNETHKKKDGKFHQNITLPFTVTETVHNFPHATLTLEKLKKVLNPKICSKNNASLRPIISSIGNYN